MVGLDPPLASGRGGREMKRLNWTTKLALTRDIRQQRVADAVGMFTITIISMSPQPSYHERTTTNKSY